MQETLAWQKVMTSAVHMWYNSTVIKDNR